MSDAAARRYARALYLLGQEDGALDKVNQELRAVADALRGSSELLALLANPVVAQEARKAVMVEVLRRLGVGATVRNAALLLTDRRRGALLPAVSEALQRLSDERSGRLHAEVTSAAALTEPQAARLKAALERLTGRAITLTRKVDPSLLAGAVTRIGDKVYDGSARTRLAELRQQALLPS
ncbi:MAG: ATP synthase F1 subunit delta [Deltaproteobacteria bacterium]|nr:ATP synthase F1 subunit delta [Deltaproteobacteria bacterium]